MSSIFQNPTKSLPKSDAQIVRVPMTQNDIGGRTGHIPNAAAGRSDQMSITHIPNAGNGNGKG